MTAVSEASTAYDTDYRQALIEGGIYPPFYFRGDDPRKQMPANWDDIKVRLKVRRPSLSETRFTEEDFDDFRCAVTDASKERMVTTKVIPKITGREDDRLNGAGSRFSNLDRLTDLALASASPDSYYGARPEQLDKQVRARLSKLVVPTTQADLPIVPNFFLEVKGPDGSDRVALNQAVYNEALGARAIHSLQQHDREDIVWDRKAYTISCTYAREQLKMFTVHILPPESEGKRPQYVTHLLCQLNLMHSIEAFREGASMYRNARDWAKEIRDKAIDAANQRVDPP
ncbi:hypothetical protein L228DRAFT_265348 [Xylona heveae TC161]|uniref:Uncharacterized protein n=1 Tax=Xylona heveae (strain CBS 132557 / TC161) TaxID=1328760 RepID=A0A161TR06_XYLHT|nr:hypothetical protein L228DRAFT_265348 [Xylona heveae TC161]KZF24836.1 hypothetical protein L228DRAFT_265348 [Xylona heveae TC161]